MTNPPPPSADIPALVRGQTDKLKSVSFDCGRIEGIGQFRGGCGKPVSAWEAYRCVDCSASYHRNCLREHLKDETEKDGVILAQEQQIAEWAVVLEQIAGMRTDNPQAVYDAVAMMAETAKEALSKYPKTT